MLNAGYNIATLLTLYPEVRLPRRTAHQTLEL